MQPIVLQPMWLEDAGRVTLGLKPTHRSSEKTSRSGFARRTIGTGVSLRRLERSELTR
jgi:hypothetical protein